MDSNKLVNEDVLIQSVNKIKINNDDWKDVNSETQNEILENIHNLNYVCFYIIK